MGKHKPKKKKSNQSENSPADGLNQATSPTTGRSPKKVSGNWMFLALLFIVVSIIMSSYAYLIRDDIGDYDSNLTNCAIELDNTLVAMEDLKLRQTKLEHDLEACGLGKAGELALPDKYIKIFNDRGLISPIQGLRTSLVKKPELIPYSNPDKSKPFRFLDRRQIYVLSPDRVFANFGTGDEIVGWILLSYKVKNGSVITWKVLKSYCPQFDG